ncbi:hypothetical protein AAEY27_11755 [Kosakonia sp. BYX6]|uniref:HNH endonuclease n=1 Tax=Kosakonia calanthes TaxID=3139408 RepID=A0ABZ3B594_9ENTR
MNRIKLIDLDDQTRLDALAKKSEIIGKIGKRTREKDIKNIKLAYDLYKLSHGNPDKILAGMADKPISRKMGGALAHYYKNPTVDINFIDTMREEFSIRTCPMCGSLGSGTLDHYLPQKHNKAFTIFSLNLVPSCLCNSKKGVRLKGKKTNQRLLHPYFDDCLQQRLVKIDIHHPDTTPTVSSHVLVPQTDADYAAVEFHFDTLVKKKVEMYALENFIDFCRRPGDLISALQRNPRDKNHLRRIIEDELESKDNYFKSKNNWVSLLLFALLDDNILTWLASKLCAPGREPNSPLVARKTSGSSLFLL